MNRAEVDIESCKAIRSLRKKAGITLKELGERVGFSYQTIGQYERGERFPTALTLARIYKALDARMPKKCPFCGAEIVEEVHQ